MRLTLATFPLCLVLLAAHVVHPRTRAPAQTAPGLTRVLLDTDANNELDDQHAIAYMLFSGDVFDVEAITVNRTRGGGDIEQQAQEAERITTLAGLRRVFPVFRGANGSFAEIAPHVGERNFDGAAAVNEIIRQAKASGARLTLVPIGKLTNIALALRKDPSIAAIVGRNDAFVATWPWTASRGGPFAASAA